MMSQPKDPSDEAQIKAFLAELQADLEEAEPIPPDDEEEEEPPEVEEPEEPYDQDAHMVRLASLADILERYARKTREGGE
jgi:hypothetical protein